MYQNPPLTINDICITMIHAGAKRVTDIGHNYNILIQINEKQNNV